MSTNINDLPNNGQNITMNVDEKPVQTQLQERASIDSNPPQHTQLSQEDINKIINGIQEASKHNLTGLPSKDIPMDQNAIVSDPEAKPNFVPKQEKQEDYINNNMTPEQLYIKQMEKQREKQKQEDIYEQLQIPVILFMLFFIFQMPFINKFLFNHIPSLFIKDGNPALSGYLVKSLLFSGLVFIIQKGIDYVSR